MLQRPFETPDGRPDVNFEVMSNIVQASNIFYAIVSKGVTPNGISRSQFDILSFIYYFGHQGPINLTEIAHVMNLSKANVSGVLSRLEQKGLIYFTKNEKDARVREIRLTSEGQKLTEETFPRYREVIDKVISNLGNEEKQALLRLLKKLCIKLDAENVNKK